MLAISRNIDQKILIGDDIEILVVRMRRGQVVLGITAPRTIPVDREEVRRAKQAPAAPKGGGGG